MPREPIAWRLSLRQQTGQWTHHNVSNRERAITLACDYDFEHYAGSGIATSEIDPIYDPPTQTPDPYRSAFRCRLCGELVPAKETFPVDCPVCSAPQ